MKRKQNFQTLASLIIAVPTIGLSFAGSPQLVMAQTDNAAALEATAAEPAQPQLDLATQKKLAADLFGLTKTAKTPQQLNAMIAECDAATASGLNKKYLAYVGSLKAWALKRRGENRYETAKQLKSIDNVAQYQLALKQALSDFDDSISIDTTQYRTFNSRGIAYVLDERYTEAANDFGKAVVLRADFTQGYFNRAEALSALGKFELAIKDYTSALRLAPGDAQALTGRGHANVALNNFAAALADYDAVIKAYPNNALALINRGDCYEASRDWRASLADYAAAKNLATTNGSSKLTDLADQRTAWVLASASDPSVRDAEKAMALIGPCVDRSSSPSVAMLETLAAAQAAMGRFQEAKQSQTKAIQLTGAEVSVDDNKANGSPHQVRMALYEDEKPFVQETPDAEPKR